MMSLTGRVALSASLVLAAFVVLTALALERAFDDSARSSMRQRLFAQVYLVMAAAEVDSRGGVRMPQSLGEPRLDLPGSGLYARIGRPDGALLWQSASAVGLEPPPPPSASLGTETFTRIPFRDTRYFLAALTIRWETDNGSVPLVFSVSEDPAPFEEQMNHYRRSLWGWLGGAALLLLLTLAGSLTWGLRPLRTVAAEVRAVESGAQERLERDYPKELRHLTDNVNALLQHERTQQVRYKNALADLAHSLKTPLAVLRNLSPNQDATLDEQLQRMDNIVQYQLQRAATAGRSALKPPLAVDPTVQRLVTTLDKVYRDKGVTVGITVAEDSRFRGDEGDLMEVLGNLLDNAYKWCAGAVWVSAHCDGTVLHLMVEDDGPGIDIAVAEQVLQRGVRADETTPGHGIGLPMVRDIAHAYGGTVAIDSSAHGGAALHVTLPG